MIVENFQQGSPAWLKARLGIPTSSQFGRIFTAKGMPSTQQDDYLDELVAQWRSMKSESTYNSLAMKEGTDREPVSRDRFCMDYELEVTEVGIVYKDERRLVACSPDGLYTDPSQVTEFSDLSAYSFTGGLEMKNPFEKTMIRYIRDGKIPDAYKPQVYGSMWVTGLDTWVFMANYPGYKPLYIKAPHDPAYMESIDVIMNNFISKMVERRNLVKTFLE